MSNATLTRPPVTDHSEPADRGQLRAAQSRVIRAEWIKLYSVRSTVVTLLSAAAVMIGLGLLFAATGGPDGGPGEGGIVNPIDLSLTGTLLAQLIVGTLGVLVATSEYSSGLIRSTLAAVPRRQPVLWAKIAVFVGVTFPVMLAAAVVAFLGGQALLGSGAGAAFGDDGVLRAIAGSAGYLTAVGVLGVAVGFLVRKVGAAIAILFGAVFALPLLANLLPASWSGLTAYLPSNVGSAIYSAASNPDLLPAGPAVAVLAGYLIALVGVAAVALGRRDA